MPAPRHQPQIVVVGPVARIADELDGIEKRELRRAPTPDRRQNTTNHGILHALADQRARRGGSTAPGSCRERLASRGSDTRSPSCDVHADGVSGFDSALADQPDHEAGDGLPREIVRGWCRATSAKYLLGLPVPVQIHMTREIENRGIETRRSLLNQPPPMDPPDQTLRQTCALRTRLARPAAPLVR